MSWQSAVLEKIAKIERETIAEVDQVVQNESNRLRNAMDTERNYLKAVLDETAREIVAGGDIAAGRAVKKALLVADAYRSKDEARAMRAEWVAIGVHDQIRTTAQQLAENVRSLEQNLAAPLIRAKRESTSDALPGLKRLVEDAAHRTAADQRRALAKRIHPPEEEIETWRKQMVDQVRNARTNAKERVDNTHRRARAEIERLVEDLAAIPDPVRKRLIDVAEKRTEQAVRAASDGRPNRVPRFRVIMGRVGLVFTALFVFFMGLGAMGAGVGFAGAAVGAIALRGAWAPPVMGGLLMGVVGVIFGALVTDLLFSRLGDWRDSLEDALLGAVTPLRGAGRAIVARDMGNALKYVEVPQLSPDRVATPATSGTLRVALRDGKQAPDGPSSSESGEVTGRIRIPARAQMNTPDASVSSGEVTGRIRIPAKTRPAAVASVSASGSPAEEPSSSSDLGEVTGRIRIPAKTRPAAVASVSASGSPSEMREEDEPGGARGEITGRIRIPAKTRPPETDE